MSKYKRSEEELKEELAEQLLALRASSASYDAGNTWEAKRLATSVYTLAHDGMGRTKSLLKQTGYKKKLRVISSKVQRHEDGVKMAWESMDMIVNIEFSQAKGARYKPPLGEETGPFKREWFQFPRWWEQRIFGDSAKNCLTRKRLVFLLRSQDGGSHVDSHLSKADYHEYKRFGDPHLRYSDDGLVVTIAGSTSEDEKTGLKPLKNGIPATMRQIAWELDHSLQAIGL